MRVLQPKQKKRKKIIFCLKLFSERTTQDEKIPKPVPSSVDFALLDEQLIRRQNIDIPRPLQGYNIVDEPKGGPEGARSLYLQFRTKF